MSVFDMSGRVVIVTGASSGLGARFARVLHAVGATVVAVARRQSRLDELAEGLPGLITMVCDVSDASQRETLVHEVIRRCGRVDVLVNNAGIGHTVQLSTSRAFSVLWVRLRSNRPTTLLVKRLS